MENKSEIIKLIKAGQLNTFEIAEKFQISPESVRAIKAHVTMGTYDDSATTNEILDAVETTFGLEKDMQIALRANITQLGADLIIIDDNKEKITDAGRIDILAKDNQGNTIIIELKAGKAKPESLTQLLAYMGTFHGNVKGILVASDFHDKINFAVKAIPNVTLKKYSFQFSFKDF